MKNDRRVVITGLGLVTPLGLTVKGNWDKALSGITGIDRLSLKDSKNSPIQAAGQVKDNDWKTLRKEFPREAEQERERRTLFALWSAKSAFKMAGIADGIPETTQRGVILGSGIGIVRMEDIKRWMTAESHFDCSRFVREIAHVSNDSSIKNSTNRAASQIASTFGLTGMNCSITTACSSATHALGMGFRAIKRGDVDLLLAGGADSMIHPLGLIVFALLGAAAMNPETPKQQCRPFDRKRSGLVVGEGAGIVVLEEELNARQRGAVILAEVAGFGSSIDAYRVTAPHPQGYGAELAMKKAVQDANMEADEIDYINAHGTGTKLNDISETIAIKNVFKDRAYSIPISSSKALIGHLMAAAGGPEFIYTVLSLIHDEIHPTLNLTHPDPKCDLDFVPLVKRKANIEAAMSNSFGFGGQNASIIVKKYHG